MAKATYIVPSLEEWLKNFRFFTNIKIRYSETDMSGHVNNTSYLVYFEQARVEYYEHIKAFSEEHYLVTADIWCHYHTEAFYPEILEVGVRVAKIGNSSFELEYVVRVTHDRRIVATGTGAVVLMSKETKKPVAIPESIRAAIAQVEGY